MMEAAALHDPPCSNLHAGGSDELIAGRDAVIEGIFEKPDPPTGTERRPTGVILRSCRPQ
jgi:hypothetical protein